MTRLMSSQEKNEIVHQMREWSSSREGQREILEKVLSRGIPVYEIFLTKLSQFHSEVMMLEDADEIIKASLK